MIKRNLLRILNHGLVDNVLSEHDKKAERPHTGAPIVLEGFGLRYLNESGRSFS